MEKYPQEGEIRGKRSACSANYYARESYLHTMRAVMADDEYTPKSHENGDIDAYLVYEKRVSDIIRTLLGEPAPQTP